MISNMIIDKLEKYGQHHLISFYNELDEVKKAKLIDQINEIDLELIQSLYNNLIEGTYEKDIHIFEPIESEVIDDSSKITEFREVGEKKIIEGKLAVVLLAGGQGTRLGHEGPKGTFDIGLDSHASLFQLQCKKLLEIYSKCGVYIKWYIMTSKSNHSETVQFFSKNNYFGYSKKHIKFFEQGMLPTVNYEGKIILEDKGKVSFSPNGNGGCFIALRESGILSEMRADGVEWIFIYGVDNALTKVADTFFLGYAINSGKDVASKVVKKASPEEKVGILCYKDNRPAIVEYSELSYEHTHAIDLKGNLVYDSANILNHLIKIDLIEKYLDNSLEYHIAYKKIKSIDSSGKLIELTKPTGYKFESFIFDIFPYCEEMAVLRVLREEEFAPVKNKDGKDSPQTARELVTNMMNKL